MIHSKCKPLFERVVRAHLHSFSKFVPIGSQFDENDNLDQILLFVWFQSKTIYHRNEITWPSISRKPVFSKTHTFKEARNNFSGLGVDLISPASCLSWVVQLLNVSSLSFLPDFETIKNQNKTKNRKFTGCVKLIIRLTQPWGAQMERSLFWSFPWN